MVSRHLRRVLLAAACALIAAPNLARALEVANPAVPQPEPTAQADAGTTVASLEREPSPAEAAQAPAAPAAAAPAPAEADDPSMQDEIDEESSDLEAMKKAEAVVSDPQAATAAQFYAGAHRLGGASSLAGRMHDVLSPEGAYLPFLPEYAGDAVDTGLASFDIDRAKNEYDIPVEMRAEVAQWIRFYQGAGRKYFRRWLARSTRYIPVMKDILRQEGLPEDMVYLSMIESGFSTMALSWAKASGPWQFIPATGTRFGLKVDFWLDERRDPIKSTRAAARYLRELHDEFGDWYLAWAGYNAGAGKVRKAIAKYGTSNFWELCAAGRFLRSETKNYVPKLIAAALVTKHAEAFGFTKAEIDWEQPVETDEVKVDAPSDISVVAKAAECDLEDLKVLNPELRRWLTPPTKTGESFVVRLPKGHSEPFAKNWPKVAPKERLVFKIHKVKRGDTLSKIASTYHSFPDAIMRMNGLKSSKKLRLNTELMIPVASDREWAAAETDPTKHKGHGGFVPTPAAEEVPAGTPAAPTNVATGTLRKSVVGGKDQVVYGIQSGDSLWTVSQKFGVTVEELKGWNELSGRKPKLKIGQELVVYPRAQVAASAAPAPAPAIQPAGPAPAQPVVAQVAVARAAPADSVPDKVTQDGNRKKIVHTLVEGDTLWSLSQRYGVSVDALKKLNHLKRRAVLHPGSTLLVEVAENR